MEFEWDARKARENLAKHGVAFDLARSVFDDPYPVLAEDGEHSLDERRFLAFGAVGGDVLTVRFPVRSQRVRIIGAGYWRKGKMYHEQANRLHR